MRYEEAVQYILDTPKFTVKNDREHTAGMLRALGNPEQDLKVIHVAGTNGKGSVCAYVAAVLKAAGRSTGLFTSPHLICINERFRIDGVPVSDAQFMEAFDEVQEVVAEQQSQGISHPTFFEFLFLMAMVLFRRSNVDYVIVETGMGGRLDATNVINHPVLTVITSIGMDHTAILGNTIEAIASEKAGIIKTGVPLICDGRNQGVRSVLLQKAEEMHAPVSVLQEEDYEILGRREDYVVFSLKNRYSEYNQMEVAGTARYQAMNAMLAIMALDHLEAGITEQQMRMGIREAVWPGRMEQVMPGVYLDGAHNPEGVSELNRRMREESRPVVLLFACTCEKDPAEMVRVLCEDLELAGVVLTETGGERRREPEELRQEFDIYVNGPVIVERNNQKSLEKALQLKGNNGILFVAGSLYLIGDIKAYLENGGSL